MSAEILESKFVLSFLALKIAAQFYFSDYFPLLLLDLLATGVYHRWQEILYNNASLKDFYLFNCGVCVFSDILCLVFLENFNCLTGNGN